MSVSAIIFVCYIMHNITFEYLRFEVHCDPLPPTNSLPDALPTSLYSIRLSQTQLLMPLVDNSVAQFFTNYRYYYLHYSLYILGLAAS